MTFRNASLAIALLPALLLGCASTSREIGPYRFVVVDGFGCQPRTEFYFVDPSKPSEPTYLGTCSTPQFVTKHLHMPSDPSCFATSDAGSSVVYYHRPYLCGAGEQAARKSGGVYLHSVKEGDRLLYGDPQHVTQLWGGSDIGNHSMRVLWVGETQSKGGAICAQSLVIDADGQEHPEGSPDQQLCSIATPKARKP